jgi:flagella basal body P-ring formation protein FlgA
MYRTGKLLMLNVAIYAGWLFGLVDISTTRNTLTEKIEAVVREHAALGLSEAGLDGEIVAIHMPRNLPTGTQEVFIKPLRKFMPPRAAGRFIIPLDIITGNSAIKINVTVETVALINGWEAREPLKRGTPLSARNFKRKIFRVIQRENEYYDGPELAGNRQLAASIAGGHMLKYQHIEVIPEVVRGEKVTIRYKLNNLILTSPGKARREGQIGDLIPVIATETGKQLDGRLQADRIVVIE